MKAFENNAFFWQKLDTLYLAGKLVVDQDVYKRQLPVLEILR